MFLPTLTWLSVSHRTQSVCQAVTSWSGVRQTGMDRGAIGCLLAGQIDRWTAKEPLLTHMMILASLPGLGLSCPRGALPRRPKLGAPGRAPVPDGRLGSFPGRWLRRWSPSPAPRSQGGGSRLCQSITKSVVTSSLVPPRHYRGGCLPFTLGCPREDDRAWVGEGLPVPGDRGRGPARNWLLAADTFRLRWPDALPHLQP